MSSKYFNTIFGRNLVAELKNIVQRPYLVVTMEDLWEKFKGDFDEDAIVHFVKTLEYDEIIANVEGLCAFNSVIGLGGGQAVDYAKIVAWKKNLPLYQVPTSIATNAVFGHRAGVRFNSSVRYMTFTEPVAVYVDYGIIQNGPRALNRSGVCDVLCYHNAAFDWKYAHDQGKEEPQWPYDQALVDEALSYYQKVVDNMDDIYNMTEKGIQALTSGLCWGGAAFHNAGWNPRHIEGTDHFLFYTLEYMTKKKFIHGQPVCLGIFTGSLMQDNEAEHMLDLIYRAGVDIRPEAMDLSWDDVFAALKYEREFVVKDGKWFTIANDFVVDDAFCNKVKDMVVTRYRDFKN